MLEKDRTKTSQSFIAFVQEAQNTIKEITAKLQRLLDGYLEQDIEREIYRTEKAKLLSEKKSLEEKITGFEQKQTGWLEPMRNWIKEAENLPKIAKDGNLLSKKVACRNIFGSNLILQNRESRLGGTSGTNSPLKTQWAALCAARDFVGKKEKSFIVERVMGIEPTCSDWQPDALPLCYTRNFVPRARLALATSSFSEKRIYYLSYRGAAN